MDEEGKDNVQKEGVGMEGILQKEGEGKGNVQKDGVGEGDCVEG